MQVSSGTHWALKRLYVYTQISVIAASSCVGLAILFFAIRAIKKMKHRADSVKDIENRVEHNTVGPSAAMETEVIYQPFCNSEYMYHEPVEFSLTMNN